MTLHERVLARTALLAATSASAWLGFAGLARAADQPSAPITVAQASPSNATGPQGGAAEAPGAQGGASAEGQLEEVVITATHFTTEANQTPLSLSTVTVGQLNEQGISTFNNLVGQVPSVQLSATTNAGLATIDIRGVIQSGNGATTGFYLDNTPLQSYAANAGPSNSTGTPLPPIFDLQRVEVLEGPQGTLFGASSEGGTIRYITPEPSLQDWQVYTKADVGQTNHGDGQNYNVGLAVGGPIIPGVLGFRASAAVLHQAGWIQMEEPVTQQIIGKGLNDSSTPQFHGELLWKPNEQFSAKASFFSSYYSAPYVGNAYNLPEPYQIAEPVLGYNTSALSATNFTKDPTPVCVGSGKTTTVLASGKSFPGCGAYTGTITYLRPAATVGPYPDLAPFTIMGEPINLSVQQTESLNMPALDLTYNFPHFTAQLFSSYMRQENRSASANNATINTSTTEATEGPQAIPVGITFLPGNDALGFMQIIAGLNERKMWSEDMRFSSVQGPTQLGAGLFSWTAGLYYQDEWDFVTFDSLLPPGGLEALSSYLYGATPLQRYGLGPLPYGGNVGPQPNLTEIYSIQAERLSNTDAAVYGEANYNITDHLQATVGLRESRLTFSFWNIHYGPTNNNSPIPTYENGAEVQGASIATAFTPKGELTYRFSPNKFIYALVDKGFRPGGANPPISQTSCGPGVATYGLTVNQIPTTFGPDSDWNYELGTKLGLDNGRVQVNADVYRLIWSQVQTSQSPVGCGTAFTANAGHAISQGGELSVQAIVAKGLLLDAALGYDHAYYSENAIAIKGAPGFPDLVVAVEGQNFNIAPWTSNVGARLDLTSAFGIGSGYHPYIRADWTELGSHNQFVYGLIGYDPDTNHVPSIPLLNLRAGMDIGPVNLNIYALNATQSLAGTRTGGRTGCTNPACTAYSTNTPFIAQTPANFPRTIGLQFTYVH